MENKVIIYPVLFLAVVVIIAKIVKLFWLEVPDYFYPLSAIVGLAIAIVKQPQKSTASARDE